MRIFLSAWLSGDARHRYADAARASWMLVRRALLRLQVLGVARRRAFLALVALSAGCFGAAQAQSLTTSLAAMPLNPRTTELNVIVLLPSDNPLLRRAALAVRDGIRAAAALPATSVAPNAAPRPKINWIDCAYGTEAVVAAYQRCVTEASDWVIGPLGRSEVTALSNAKLSLLKPTLLLSPLGAAPKAPFAVLSPDLESEVEAIVRQAGDDACRKPLLIESAGSIASRVSVAINAAWRAQSAISLASYEMTARDRWQRAADGWRKSGVDCVLFAGSGATLLELRPFLRDITIYATSASYEIALDRTSDWTGVRMADAPLVIDGDSETFAPLKLPDSLSPTLVRLFALGVDAARLIALAAQEKDGELPAQHDGALGGLKLQDAQYRRTPMIGEFRGYTPTRLNR